MLLSIDIRNFAIIRSLQLDWQSGMSVITGETGAGKSIVIDALGLVLGERAEQSVISSGASQTEISALFEVELKSAAFQWLSENDLLDHEQGSPINECILRRVLIREGRSKCYINGRSVTQSQQKQLGLLLVDIHGQHANQSLLKTKEQLNLLDRYANHSDLLDNVKLAYQQLRAVEERRAILQEAKLSRDAKRELLTYQVDELITANPEKEILDNLEQEHKQAANSQERLLLSEHALGELSSSETTSSCSLLNTVISKLKELETIDPEVANLVETLVDAETLLQEASAELSNYQENLTNEPDKLASLDQQLTQFHDLARKHQVNLKELPDYFVHLQNELSQIQADDSELEEIQEEYDRSIELYLKQAKLLTNSRHKVAKELAQQVCKKIQPLAMEGGEFSIRIRNREEQYSANGLEDIEFMVSANPGQPLKPLNKVASGGELSRISLAISVITSEQQLVPCIIFDEVDVGIGGATAETVGILLRELAKQKQVLCVTHQPQVASCGNQHLIASKTKEKDSTTTEVVQLTKEQRVQEIARMLGGQVISDKTISHAKEMLLLS
jgi:DNA repair protein RecN (Recombination protein N)